MSNEPPENLSEELLERRAALMNEIFIAFAGVVRDGGVSWSEAQVLDNFGSEEECREARLSDQEPNWESMVNDEIWGPENGVEWCYLDAIGFRYYLPAMLIRAIDEGETFNSRYHLTLPSDWSRDLSLNQWSLLSSQQKIVVRKFLILKAEIEAFPEEPSNESSWLIALRSYWDG